MVSVLLQRLSYTPPPWASALAAPTHGRIKLGHLPTPLMRWACGALSELGVRWSIKRDDLSGNELSGNKVRKLEFLMAEAVAGGHDCVVTIGGVQSNHCRATAAAARLVGIDAHLILLVRDKSFGDEPGLQGNLLLDRLLGATLHLCSGSDYLRQGGDLAAMNRINEQVAAELRRQGRVPYIVPVGGTTPLGTWGYLSAAAAAAEEAATFDPIDHIVFAVGSGGTAAGLALGSHLAGLRPQLHGVAVHHSPEHFYDLVDAEVSELSGGSFEACAREMLAIYPGAGAGYGVATPELMAFCAETARQSGVLLDHTYSGKALYYFAQAARAQPERFRGKHILFWHTGGARAPQKRNAKSCLTRRAYPPPSARTPRAPRAHPTRPPTRPAGWAARGPHLLPFPLALERTPTPL
ncbi:hypothetical protein EMIHUDRAFT_429282 [Emiliania huxleyi CCMP1516]|uniref:Tryptophan synthase beta chain-like PALP domain-containing protein n=2 Tax=Emiliania huxleyi TaxID=2903 RepID=A0A0D3KH65_EMIH1|nr:hypothetical protein EMIHUDRAFT_429282 [Emiliania huxleyi CCMP1516]EOD35100.1 hypothetical protein EMIHUDRAFT_429282 [Emiliania huxleyi CCMP1516]|eukprot:XP_005787529.1 hypothetical protein EMIHUDRAFT_429282 [Emiliania huxleyi CCMP1516]